MRSSRTTNNKQGLTGAVRSGQMPLFAHPDQYRNKDIKATKYDDEGNKIGNGHTILGIKIIQGEDLERRWCGHHNHSNAENHHHRGNTQ